MGEVRSNFSAHHWLHNASNAVNVKASVLPTLHLPFPSAHLRYSPKKSPSPLLNSSNFDAHTAIKDLHCIIGKGMSLLGHSLKSEGRHKRMAVFTIACYICIICTFSVCMQCNSSFSLSRFIIQSLIRGEVSNFLKLKYADHGLICREK